MLRNLSTRLPDHPAAARTHARWRWPMLALLLATIPAFYVELLDADARWYAGAVYGLTALTLALAQWRQARHHRNRTAYWRRQTLDAVLVPGLLASALLPTSAHSTAALALRLAVAALTLVRLVALLRPWVERGSLRHVALLTVGVLGACGAGFWWLEPRTPTLADGLWLAFTTAATVGYGDVVPTTTASKIFAVFVVLLGYAALSLVTAGIAARWVESSERQLEDEILSELHREVRELRREIAALRAEREARNSRL